MVGKTKKAGFPPTPRQQNVWAYIVEYYSAHGYMPFRREIAIAVGTTVPAVNIHLRGLAERGKIELDPRTHRGIRFAE